MAATNSEALVDAGRRRVRPVDADQLWPFIRDIPDFPQPGVVFRDITPLLGDAGAFRAATELLAAPFDGPITKVVGIEARGFILAAPIALALGAGFVPVRKPGKLPHKTRRRDYDLEYGTDALEMHADAVVKGARVVVVDDLLATGGTAAATIELVREIGGDVVGAAFVVELELLRGRKRLGNVAVEALLKY
jgi:adenine phosphoribosyltransferase